MATGNSRAILEQQKARLIQSQQTRGQAAHDNNKRKAQLWMELGTDRRR